MAFQGLGILFQQRYLSYKCNLTRADNVEMYLTMADKYDVPSLKNEIRVRLPRKPSLMGVLLICSELLWWGMCRAICMRGTSMA